MQITGILKKMESQLTNPVSYSFILSQNSININQFINSPVKLTFSNKINCLHCGAQTKKSFGQGYCYKCFITIPETDPSVINPELNQAHLGISRDMEWSRANDLIEHIVYLSYTSNIKVGVTRITNLYQRWIDQGAQYAIILAKTPYRQLAGAIEVELKQVFADKTNWRKMLQQPAPANHNLVQAKKTALENLSQNLKQFYYTDNTITSINYPVNNYPQKIDSLSFDKTPVIEGVLTAIKGQYLIFDNCKVLNIRKFGGYNITFEHN